jgi:hypothetical protein
VLGALHLAAGPGRVLIFLPGTQVGTTAPPDSVGLCRNCHHAPEGAKPVTIFRDWYGSMMAHSARDPVFYAALAAANKYNAVAGQAFGEYCIRCHSPTGWLAGHSEDYTGMSLEGTDFDGIQCDYCHRVVDPLNPDTSAPPLSFPVPGYGNGMHVVQRYASPKRGTLDTVAAPHAVLYDGFLKKSELCGICHDVSNPFYAADRVTQPPHTYAPMERTYSEWLMSWYATRGDSGTCQSCHMPVMSGYACIFDRPNPHPVLHRHELTGGNAFVPSILADFWPGLDTAALGRGAAAARATLRRAARLSAAATATDTVVLAEVTVTNLTGHKLPTGFPEGRRMWLTVTGTGPFGETTFVSGRYDADSARLLTDAQLKTYEAIRGISPARAAQFGLPAGPAFHFALDDTVLFDNRIPPRGYTVAGFLSRLAQPVGAVYADSQYWDITSYRLPPATTAISVQLLYQTISREYVEFLRSENAGNALDWNAWGEKLHAAWEARGRSAPVLIDSITIPVEPAAVRDGGPDATAGYALHQNYPNPFNPQTTITYVVPRASRVGLTVFDTRGRRVASVVTPLVEAGTHEMTIDASAWPTGVYFYRLTSGSVTLVRKMMLIR